MRHLISGVILATALVQSGCGSMTSAMTAEIATVVITKPTSAFAGATVGTSFQLTATAYSSAGTRIEGEVRIVWSSSNPDAMTVDANGLVTAQRVGSSAIAATATYNGKSVATSVSLSTIATV